MTAASAALSWPDLNQRYLVECLAELRARLEARTSNNGLHAAVDDARAAMSVPPALEMLCAAFGLSMFERAIVLLCAGVEFDSAFAAACAKAHAEPTHKHPTFSLAFAMLPEPHWSALAPDAPLRRWRIIEVGAGPSLIDSPLRIDERVLHYLAGVRHLDEHLAGLVEWAIPVSTPLPPSHAQLVSRATAAWAMTDASQALPVIQLCGAEADARRQIAANACAALHMDLASLESRLVPSEPAELQGLVRLWQRESALSRSALLVECGEPDAGETQREWAVDRFLNSMGGAVLVSTRDRRRDLRRGVVTLEVARLSRVEQLDLWTAALGEWSDALTERIRELVAHFDLDAARIHTAVVDALSPSPLTADELAQRLWDACRSVARPRLDELAQRLQPRAVWAELVLPDPQLASLRQVAVQVRHRGTVYDNWGFGARSSRGLGITALFAGPSGTGKTMAAEVLASDLRLDLYRIDLSQVVSKYIGETEKNLRRIFDAAEEGGAILLFDEADALFGKRTEIKDSHDRYANIEVSYLLQRMEAYRGLAVLTTNLRSALDGAFLRRLRFVIQFPFPDAERRAEIWRRAFPPATPTSGLDPQRLARLNVAGGSIINIALGAAFLAADAGEPVRMSHIAAAARTEFAKLEKPLPETELGDM